MQLNRLAGRIRVVDVVDGFDLVDFRLDHPAPPELLRLLEDHCVHQGQQPLFQPYQHRLRCRLRVIRPTARWLETFHRELPKHIAAECYYAELCRDFITSTRHDARALHIRLAAALALTRAGAKVKNDRGTSYYSRRGSQVLTAYHGKGHKGLGEHQGCPCLHVELRLQGKSALVRYGIARAGDLIAIDFDRCWDALAAFRPLPLDLRHIGAALGDGRRRVGDPALRKRAHQFLKAGKVSAEPDGSRWFYMHEAIRVGGKNRLPVQKFSEWEAAATTRTTLLI